MGKNNKNSKRQRYSKREEEKANRLFKGICIGPVSYTHLRAHET